MKATLGRTLLRCSSEPPAMLSPRRIHHSASRPSRPAAELAAGAGGDDTATSGFAAVAGTARSLVCRR
eukprot:CAMPEP_0203811856 /NCGR_PEP_ID=MMETSP0115-20131106/3819_1 /ASSEMBLY_ACC=CAM_ASM_000227 /TAXON_ID=33651 /ORGANISM="Bicosoecid sp, Strain ms1" /LENGTH=67 /DNA_ID=CAMNT_0050720693 /DNA_START=16 /DNA_END=215 /DNA_ORIENTATION=+